MAQVLWGPGGWPLRVPLPRELHADADIEDLPHCSASIIASPICLPATSAHPQPAVLPPPSCTDSTLSRRHRVLFPQQLAQWALPWAL